MKTPQAADDEQIGDTPTVAPVSPESLTGIDEVLAMFSPEFKAMTREFHVEREPQWVSDGTAPAKG